MSNKTKTTLEHKALEVKMSDENYEKWVDNTINSNNVVTMPIKKKNKLPLIIAATLCVIVLPVLPLKYCHNIFTRHMTPQITIRAFYPVNLCVSLNTQEKCKHLLI